jgi:hypothetical protein
LRATSKISQIDFVAARVMPGKIARLPLRIKPGTRIRPDFFQF